MREDIKAQWVKDLRDGTRTQTTGTLRNKYGGQCCLDVLCEQAIREGVIAAPSVNLNDETMIYYWGDPDEFRPEGKYAESSILPSPVRDWAQLDTGDPILTFPNPRFIPPDENPDAEWDSDDRPAIATESLAELNDSWQMEFPEIADLIEAYL